MHLHHGRGGTLPRRNEKKGRTIMLNTEKRNPLTTHIDKMSTAEMLAVMQSEYQKATEAVAPELPAIGAAIDAISARMKKGGRLFYTGCGTSGRLGVIDASECPPTYGIDHGIVVGIMAGGDGAIRRAVEGAEDSREAGRLELAAFEINENDSLVGISVAGGAQYVLGALELAREKGALTVALSCNAGCPIEEIADIAIHPDTGAEVVTGSTRMKAGSAHKMILNMISTAVMVKQGHVYENMMINLRPANVKLRDRMIRILVEITALPYADAEALLEANEFSLKRALAAFEKQ
ncbi:MAG: N-acetylmuramic acid 6-phosphate etherase [Ruminococcaceae bacterium]|nr:N-acetylmuramic acid 6-phosphate etherase [Oscillospiraceae bacterium]